MQIVMALGAVVIIGAMIQGTQMVSSRSKKSLVQDRAKLEGFYAGELAAIQTISSARVSKNLNDKRQDITTYSNDYGAVKFGTKGPVGSAVGLDRTAKADTAETFVGHLNKLSSFVLNAPEGRFFCGEADLSFDKSAAATDIDNSGTGDVEVCFSQKICPPTPPAACFDQSPIRELYRALLGREATNAEVQAHVNTIVDGSESIKDIQNTLRLTPEYFNNVPAGPCAYSVADRNAGAAYVEDVIALYRTFYGRLPNMATNEHFAHVRSLMRCPFDSGGTAGLAAALDAVIAAMKSSAEFIDPGGNNSVLHAEAIRELYLKLYGRDPVVSGNGFADTLGPLTAWIGLMTREEAERTFSPGSRFRMVTIDPAYSRAYKTAAPFDLVSGANLLAPDLWAGGGAGVEKPASTAMLASEIESNPVPRPGTGMGMTEGTAVPAAPNPIDGLNGYEAAGGAGGEIMTGLFRTMLGRAPAGPYPRDESNYYQTLMSAPYNAPNTYVVQMLQSSGEFATRGGGCGCTSIPAPLCSFTAPKTTINSGENITLSLHVYANNQIDAGGRLNIGRPAVGWNGISPAGSITSVYWGSNQTVFPGFHTYTVNRTGGAGGTTLSETATVAGPGGSYTCSINIAVASTVSSCTILQSKRGPGPFSRWNFGSPRGDNNDGNRPYSIGGTNNHTQDFYNGWTVWIPGRPPSDYAWGTSYRYGAGYNYVGPGGAAVLGGNYDPCNRNYGVCTGVGSLPATPMPATFVYSGNTYRLMTRPSDGTPQTYLNGGICGSPDCLCYLSGVVSPLVVDFAGNGIQVHPGVSFNLGQGKKNHFWPKHPDDVAFVVLDRNGDGRINDFNELFGSPTVGPNGKKSKNGFEALREYDENHDLSIDRYDAVFSELRLWFDRNRDGKSDPSELETLDQRQLDKIDLYYSDIAEPIDHYGNEIRQTSLVRLTDGSLRRVVDVWLAEGNPNDRAPATKVSRK